LGTAGQGNAINSNTWIPQLVNYVAIGGEIWDINNLATNIGTSMGYGDYNNNGVLYFLLTTTSPVNMRDITDGTSNTICVSEQGNWSLVGTTKTDVRSCCWAGGPWAGNAGAVAWGQNVTYLRYAVNTLVTTSLASGYASCYSGNNALTSAHPGGVLALRVDGSTAFLTDTIDFRILLQLANRADGVPLPSM
jgi:hypothetical protein